MPEFPIDPRAAAALVQLGLSSPHMQQQMMQQGGLPFQQLTRMEFQANQEGNTERLQRIRDIMDRRRQAFLQTRLTPQPRRPADTGGASTLMNAANELNRASPFMLFEHGQFDDPLREGQQGDFRIFR